MEKSQAVDYTSIDYLEGLEADPQSVSAGANKKTSLWEVFFIGYDFRLNRISKEKRLKANGSFKRIRTETNSDETNNAKLAPNRQNSQ